MSHRHQAPQRHAEEESLGVKEVNQMGEEAEGGRRSMAEDRGIHPGDTSHLDWRKRSYTGRHQADTSLSMGRTSLRLQKGLINSKPRRRGMAN